jgi:serine/threonine protein phosphatase PrpC
MPRRKFAGKTDIGLKRKNNEDAFFIGPDLHFCLAADGIGGAAAGAVASKIFAESTIETFTNISDRSGKEIKHRIQKAFRLANDNILKHVNQNPDHQGMGCTAELLAFSDEGFIVGHIGDSRTYCLRNRQLEQLTRDHTIVQQQLEAGLITRDRIKQHPMRNVIFRSLGLTKEPELDLLKGKACPEDLFLLCSDGLTDMVPDDQICDILCSGADIDSKVEELIEAAKSAGGNDNITVVLAAVY